MLFNNYVDKFKLYSVTPSFTPKTFNTYAYSYPMNIYKDGSWVTFIFSNSAYAADGSYRYKDSASAILTGFTQI
jgi:hypothetical protein